MTQIRRKATKYFAIKSFFTSEFRIYNFAMKFVQTFEIKLI